MTNALNLPYRPNAGIALFNKKGELFIGQRSDKNQSIWQCPQGGIDQGETPIKAGFRELYEETGTQKATYIGERKEWISYDLPQELIGTALDGRYRGQKQKWIIFSFDGDDNDINLNIQQPPEFLKWQWCTPKNFLSGAYNLGFKKNLYQKIMPDLVEIFNSYHENHNGH